MLAYNRPGPASALPLSEDTTLKNTLRTGATGRVWGPLDVCKKGTQLDTCVLVLDSPSVSKAS